MDTTPVRAPPKPSTGTRTEGVRFNIAQDTPTPVRMMSPPKDTPSPRRSQRIKKPPPITPRRFTKFFAPRPGNAGHKLAKARIALRDVADADLNMRNNENADRPAKRRRLSFTGSLISSSLPSSPARGNGFLSSSQDYHVESGDDQDVNVAESEDDSEASTDIEEPAHHGRRKRYQNRSLSARLLATRLDGRSMKGARSFAGQGWQDETSAFYSSPQDRNADHGSDQDHNGRPALPFCVTSCNTNSLVAVGDEDGYIRLIDSAMEHRHDFSKTYLVMRAHDNAIMDLEFSQDDKYIATASGDQTCQIIDVQKQKSVWTLTGHSCSVKKVQFQPNEPSILASCARDGSINIWDVRENPGKMPPRQIVGPMTDEMEAVEPKHTIWDAHQSRMRTRSATFSGRSDFSVTSLTFLDTSRPHLIATASESDTIVKLWDIRSKHSYRTKTVPVSCTVDPNSHTMHRHFGITSMAVSTDTSKIYTLCRDHTVYAYSTSHLMLGSAPEMSSTAAPWKNMKLGHQTGLGPLYGFRDHSMAITTFYLKLALRRATETSSELLAIGSSDHCAVLFPTDERYLTKAARRVPPLVVNASNHPTGRLRLTRTDSQSTSLALLQRAADDDIPIYYTGTPLVRGHINEVTAVTWSTEGSLVTISDDLTVRCWREEPDKAREMRVGYEGEASRHGSGWAAVRDAKYDHFEV